jgi:hypothetical protein
LKPLYQSKRNTNINSHQIAAKKAKAAKAGRSALTEEEIEEDEDDALLTSLAPGGEIAAREAHHTEAQVSLTPLEVHFLLDFLGQC